MLQEILEKMRVFSRDYDAESEKQAYEVLSIFLFEYKKIKPKKIKLGYGELYTGYLMRLFLVRKALVEKKYADACLELYDFFHYNNLYQIRIHVNIIRTLETYL